MQQHSSAAPASARAVAPEKQPCFAPSTGCKYWPIFKQADGSGLNDWKIVTLVKKRGSQEDEEEAYEEVLAGITETMAEQITPEKYGAFSTLDEDADGYYVIKFTSAAYTLQQDVELPEYTPALVLKAGELVCDAEYFNKVGGASLWYTPMQGEGSRTKVRVQQVLAADLNLAPISVDNKLPSNMSKKKKEEATKLGALKVKSEDHEELLDEINRRECIEYEDDVDGDSDEDCESEESDSEGDGAGDDE